jgi:hypothetical protein
MQADGLAVLRLKPTAERDAWIAAETDAERHWARCELCVSIDAHALRCLQAL